MLFWRVVFLIMIGFVTTLIYAEGSTSKVQGVFHSVVVGGTMTVHLHQTSGSSYAVAHGDSRDLIYLEFLINQDWLKVNLGKGYPHYAPVSIDIWVNNLQNLVQRKDAKVTGHQINSSYLSISAAGTVPIYLDGHINLEVLHLRGASHVEISGIHSRGLTVDMRQRTYAKLEGNINFCQLNLFDDAWLSLYWLRANRLHMVYGGRGFVQLAGRVNVLDLELYGHARFAGRYLRADRAFVRTHDFSVAQISVERAQHTLALDGSHIDYYNVPLMKTDFMIENATVLDLREWNLPYPEEDVAFGD